ncbi:MAG: electron transporter RnfB [Bacilli bacterium]|jgi:electron transport complex protein RnfB|nr:electron transporter RnfB [Bacilli bacterium]
MLVLAISSVGLIFVAVALMVILALTLGIAIATVSDKFKVQEDPRAGEVVKMMPGANCGGCGYPGCAGLVDAFVNGKVTKVKTCKVINQENAQKVVDYLNSTKGPDGKTLKVTL